MLAFYVVPLLPFLSMDIGMIADKIILVLPSALRATLFVLVILAVVGMDLALSRDHYTLNVTRDQSLQLQFVRDNIPPSAKLVVDDDLWVDLHERNGQQPMFPYAHSHWKVSGDPEIREQLLGNDWRNIDYLILSDDLPDTIQRENEQIVLDALRNSRVIAQFEQGDILLQVRQVNK